MTELILCELNETTDPEVESYSPFCLKVRRALTHSGLQWTSRRRARPALHRDVNPLGQVPVLLVDGEPVADSTRILRRIEALVDGDLSAPERAAAILYEELADTGLNGFVVAARWADEEGWANAREAFFGEAPWIVRTVIAPRLRAGVLGKLEARDVWRGGAEACWARLDALLDALDLGAPEQGGWVSEGLSAADYALFGQLQSFRCGLTPSRRAQVEARPRLTSYLDRIDRLTQSAGRNATKPSPSSSAAARRSAG